MTNDELAEWVEEYFAQYRKSLVTYGSPEQRVA